MVTINKDGHVIISLDDLSYDLNVSKDYSDFLLKVTSPSSDVNLNEDCFTIEEGLDDDKSAKARSTSGEAARRSGQIIYCKRTRGEN